MKKLLNIFVLLCAVMFVAACTADYDTFGESDYNNFSEISFDEASGDAAFDSDAHVITVSLKAPPDSIKTWDSITVSSLKMSHMASLYLVESRFKEFPKDSAALDSLAREVAYSDDKIKVDSKIHVPASHVLYLLVVSESGEPSIWKMVISVEGETSPAESQGENEDSPTSAGSTSSNSEQLLSSSAVVVLNSENYLTVRFANVLKQSVVEDTIFLRLKSDQTLETAVLESYEISEGAAVSPKPDEVKSWSENQTFVVTAEDGTAKQWRLNLVVADPDEVASSDKELVSISAEGEVKAATIDNAKKTVTLHMNSKTAAMQAKVTAVVSPTASMNISKGAVLNLTTKQTLTITAEDVSSDTWTLTADYYPEPRIKSMKIGGLNAVVDSVVENGAYFRWVHIDSLDFLADLTSLAVSDIKLTEGASAQVKSTQKALTAGSKYDLGSGLVVAVSNGGETQEYEIRAGYQLTGSDFNSWDNNNVKPTTLWGNANTILTTTKKYSSGTVVGAKLVTGEALGKKASASLYTAVFNPNGVSTIGSGSMADESSWPDGNELIDFGKEFGARPRYVDFTFSYTGKTDSCDMYILLENRTSTSRKVAEGNTLVASAWYRSTTDDNTGRTNPDVISVSQPNAAGMRTIRLKLKYGEPLSGSPIENSSVFTTTIRSTVKDKPINNGLFKGDGSQAVTHVRVVFASSAAGNFYKGVKDATLIVDEMSLIY